ncbi:intermembrane phospholipid transport protein YdbH family protein [Marinobacterium lutimaris]|uniref:Dicarboxylate transport n=1 Tax=Marinobacterium lutimaris TaxID=568106 RepID=A0A1H5ZB71_9GAMM|nr:YdbH domain-containing protein [Marinobacterium lutimaris]SEG33314.1 Dicarboxylate transport [Marinobacterium lutimaris]
MRKLLWVLIPLILLSSIGYAALPYLARNLIEEWLAEQGFTDPKVQLSHPGWDRLEIPSLSLTQQGDERRIDLHSANISIYFDPIELAFERQIKEIRIPELNIDIRAERSLEKRIESSGEASFDLNRYPPSLLFHFAPSNRLVIGQVNVDYRAPEQPRLQATGNLDLTPEQFLSWARILVADESGTALVAPVYMDLRFNQEQEIELNLFSERRRLLANRGTLATGTTDWGLKLDSELNLEHLYNWSCALLPELPLQPETGRLNSQLELRWPARIPLDTAALLTAIDASSTFDLEAQARHFKVRPDIAADQISLNAQGRVRLKQAVAGLQLDKGSSLSATQLLAPQLKAGAVKIALQQTFNASHSLLDDAAAPRTQLDSLQVSITPETLDSELLDSLELAPIALKLGYEPDSAAIDYTVQTDRIATTLDGKALPAFSASLNGGTASDGQRGRLSIVSDSPSLRVNAFWLLGPQQFRADWTSQPLDIPSAQPVLRRWIPGWPIDLAFTHGNLTSKGYIQGPTPGDSAVNAELKINNLAFAWDTHVETDNLNASLNLGLDRSGRLSSSGTLSSDLIRTGVDLHDTTLSYRYTQPGVDKAPTLTLAPFSQPLFGGLVSLPEFSFNPLAPDFTVNAQLEGIELSELLALYQQPGLSGDTPLSGTLPIRVQGSEISVSGGEIHSASEGWLRYEPSSALSSTAQGNPALQLALSALTDLQIKALDLKVSYAPDGSLELNSRLQGHNPDWQQGRPIDLSLNVEENLLALLNSLQLSEKIGDSLRKNLENKAAPPQ